MTPYQRMLFISKSSSILNGGANEDFDGLCLPIALILAKVRFEKGSRATQGLIHSSSKLRNEALAILGRLDLTPNVSHGIECLRLMSNMPEFLNYNIQLFQFDLKRIFHSNLENETSLNLMIEDGHYYVITSLLKFGQWKEYCRHCDTGYAHHT
jgi:hypothetical protein